MIDISNEALAGIIAGLGAVIILVVIIAIALVVFYLVGVVKLYQKAGQAGWKAIIPYYNNYVFCEMVGLEWYWFLVISASSIVTLLQLSQLTAIASLVTIFGNVALYYNLAKITHKSTGWIVLTVFFGWITIPLLGYSKDTVWDTKAPVSKNAFIDDKKN